MFRSNPLTLSKDDVSAILKKHNFYCRETDWTKAWCNPNGRGQAHQYQSQTIQGDQVVIDQASGLMWQQGGSDEYMEYEAAKNWMTNLNQRGYAGYKDWRLPTLEEAMSLMEREIKQSNLHIDPIFDKKQFWIWTADALIGSAAAWVIGFSLGGCSPYFLNNCVRAVRSGQSSTNQVQEPPLEEAQKPDRVKPSLFRSQPQPLSEKDVQAIIKKHDFYCPVYNWNKAWCNPDGHGLVHQYQSQTIQGDQVVIEHTSRLMWQQGGSDEWMPSHKQAEKWITDLNQRGFAGYKDWRLPTLEEAMSLMEREPKQGNLYIDPIFNKKQYWIWTADAVVGSAAVWVVNFGSGNCLPNLLFHDYYVRAVREGKSSQEIPKSEPIPASPVQKQPPAAAPKPAIVKPLLFRSQPQPLSEKDVEAIFKKYDFYCCEFRLTEGYCNPNGRGFTHKYQLQIVQDDEVIIDRESGLMWHQGCSDKFMNFEFAREWIAAQNEKGYAGFSDWRLPTLEEAMSLMESEKKNGNLNLDPVFDRIQCSIWTADPVFGSEAAWIIDFVNGDCGSSDFDNYYGISVFGVRSEQSSQETTKFEPLPGREPVTSPIQKPPLEEAQNPDRQKPLLFRSQPQPLSDKDVQVMLKNHDFYCGEYDWTKAWCNPNGRGLAHQYQSQTIQGDQVVIDGASGLMWQQGGSDTYMEYEAAKKWITNLNQCGYASYKDWRLPTLEEAMSLMDQEKKHGNLYIDPIFDNKQLWLWTADALIGWAAAWVVNLGNGSCLPGYLPYNFSRYDNYVRAVRSGQ